MAELLNLSQHYQRADEIAEGRWFRLDSGLEVLVARINSPEFQRWAAVAAKRFGTKGTRREIPADKMGEAAIFVNARAVFLGFRGPGGAKRVAINDGEPIEDSVAGREQLLRTYPDLLEEIARLSGLSASEFRDEVEAAAKN